MPMCLAFYTDLQISTTPVRRVIERGSVHANGRFASRLMRRTIVWEYQREIPFLLRAELDPSVAAIYAQPMMFNVTVCGRLRSYVPDFAVVYGGRTEIHEVIPDDKALDREVLELTRAAARHVSLRGGVYSVALESELKTQPVFGNLRDLWRNLHTRAPAHTCTAVLDCAQSGGPMTVAKLAEAAWRWDATPQRVLAMAAQRHLRLDLNRPVNRDSLVWAPEAFRLPTRLLPLHVPEVISP